MLTSGKGGTTMQIGDLAAQSGVPAKTIRYYETVGLLPPPARAANNYRQYRATDVARLRFIASARGLGIGLTEIAAILAARDQGIPPCDQLLGTLDTQLAALDQRIADLLILREDLHRIRTLGVELPRDDVAGLACVCALVTTYRTSGAASVHHEESILDERLR